MSLGRVPVIRLWAKRITCITGIPAKLGNVPLMLLTRCMVSWRQQQPIGRK